MFDISQKSMTNRTSVYRDQEGNGEVNARHIDHVALRTMRPDAMAEFYRDVFELAPSNKGAGDRNHYLTDGHMTLVIMPWDITDYDGTGIITAGMDHIGFKVESVEKLKEDVERIAANNPLLAPAPVGTGAEGKKLLELFRRSCPLGQHHLADCDGVLIDIARRLGPGHRLRPGYRLRPGRRLIRALWRPSHFCRKAGATRLQCAAAQRPCVFSSSWPF